MEYSSLLSFGAALLSGVLAGYIFSRGKGSFVSWMFTIGALAITVERIFAGFSLLANLPEEVIWWQRLRFVATALIPGTWLLFSLGFARTNYKEYLARWRWVILAAFFLPLFITILFIGSFFKGLPILETPAERVIPLGWSGNVFHIIFLINSVFILMNLESTLRASSGTARWQIKFMILGLAGFFAVRVFTSSEALLYYRLNLSLEGFNAAAIVVADILIILSLVRSRILNVDIYLSEAFLYKSFTVIIVGTYLFAVGILAKMISLLYGRQPFLLEGLFVFLAFLGLTIILLSNQLREQVKRFIHLYFRRPRYDYRKVWASFSQRTSPLLDVRDICAAVVKIVSETFGLSSATIWLIERGEDHLELGGSTAFSKNQAQSLKVAGKDAVDLIRVMRCQEKPIDFDRSESSEVEGLKQAKQDIFREAQMRYCVSLFAGQELLGVMTLNERVTKEPFSEEDFDLLKTIADQAAGIIVNSKMSERLRQSKEKESLQTMSAFFLHDLKNLASTLSLTVQNLPVHFGNPEFRNDVLRATQRSLSKINSLCAGLSTLSQKLELKKEETDLNELVASTFTSLNGGLKASLNQDLQPVPRLFIDPEQVRKVLTNLFLNAEEAISNGGLVRVTTAQKDGWVLLSVSDNGCGMSKEFMERSLFYPFKTTKKQGTGIGLFQSKMIVEAHGGRIEVESEEGKGSTFRVFLPLKGA